MKNTTDELLKYAIQNSRETFSKNGYVDEESLESWLGHSLYYLYQNNTTTGFSRDSEDALSGIDKNSVLNFLANKYLEKIKETENANIRDEFQNILKEKLENEGMENTEDALKIYISTGDVSKFPEKDRDDILKYKPDSLLQAMGIVAVKMVLQEAPANIDKNFSHQNKQFFSASDFAVLSNGEYNIDKIVGLMEGIRTGRVSYTTENNIELNENIGR